MYSLVINTASSHLHVISIRIYMIIYVLLLQYNVSRTIK